MDNQIYSQRIGRVMNTVQPLLQVITDPEFAKRGQDPEDCDFALGDPHEMPLDGFVNALQRWGVPQSQDWFAYKMNEAEPRRLIAEDLLKWRGIVYDPEDIFLTNGAFAAITVALGAVVDAGDEVIFISPPWFFYEALIVSFGATAVRVRVNPETMEPDLEAIEAAMTARTRAIIINSPNNPTGKIYSSQFLSGLSHLLMEGQKKTGRPIYLLSDEAYSRILYDGRSFISPTAFTPHAMLLYTYGKTLLTPGQRLGYIVLPREMPEREELRPAILASQMVTGYAFPNALLQHAIGDLNQISIDIKKLENRRNVMVRELREMGYEVHQPEATFYLLPRSPISDDEAFMRILAKRKIYCLPGKMMEMPGYFRISLTASDEMVERSLAGFASAMKEVRQIVNAR
jgi:aspartate aminotransferase